MLPAALVLTIMIIPITSAICRELFSRVPRDLTDGSLALGSTRWEAIRGVTFAYAAPGISAAVLLGLGRAFGEAIAVTQVIGGGNSINRSLFAPGDTLASRIAEQYQGATSQLQVRSILYLGAILLVISLVTNVVRAGDREQVREGAEGRHEQRRAAVDPYDITVALEQPRRRRLTREGVRRCSPSAAARASRSSILALVLGTVVLKGLERARPRLLHRSRGRCSARRAASPTRWSGARSSSGWRSMMAVPIADPRGDLHGGVRRAEGVSTFLRVVLDVLNGVPAIVVGIFIFGLLVVGHGQSAIFGAMALAILMIPMVARATQEVLELVPRSLREASLALGVTRWRTTWSIVLPTAIGGILTGVVIAVARVAGETAPLLFTSSIAANEISYRRLPRAADAAGGDLRVLGVARPGRSGGAPGRPRSS